MEAIIAKLAASKYSILGAWGAIGLVWYHLNDKLNGIVQNQQMILELLLNR